MFTSSSARRLRESFAARFETVGADVFFRRNAAAAPTRVTPDERDDFIAGYARTMRYSSWGVVAGTIAVLGVVMVVAFRSRDGLPQWVVSMSVGVVLAASLAVHWWAWTRPWRTLQYRMASGQPRSPAELKRLFFARLSYGRLAVGAGMAPLMVLNAARMQDVFHGWARLWIVGALALLLIVSVQAFRKWRYESGLKRP